MVFREREKRVTESVEKGVHRITDGTFQIEIERESVVHGVDIVHTMMLCLKRLARCLRHHLGTECTYVTTIQSPHIVLRGLISEKWRTV